MKKVIIIIGTGKAAYLHYLKYRKMHIKNIYFINPIKTSKYVKDELIYESLDFVLSKIKKSFVIVDICTPKTLFKNIVDEIISKGIKNIIVEKPFVVEQDYFKGKDDINILMIENYKFSHITELIKKIIKINKLKVLKIYTNFSKNRIKDSISGRGMINPYDVTTCFEIEIPHQIYLANFLIDSDYNVNFKYAKSMSLKTDGLILKKHKYAFIEYEDNGVDVIHESNLTTNDTNKIISIKCSNNINIEASFITYDQKFNKINDGFVNIYISDQLIKNYKFKIDDNMFECLKKYINIFCKNSYNQIYKKEILNFSKILNYCLSYEEYNEK